MYKGFQKMTRKKIDHIPKHIANNVEELIDILTQYPKDAKVYSPVEFANRGDLEIHKNGTSLALIILTGI